ncbi:MAG: glucose-1-phosphate adenylyltransferase [Nitrospinota bacterium]
MNKVVTNRGKESRILAMIMAGGKGERLYPLTCERTKPAVPFGGKYRIIDFVLSNFINSGIYSIYVLAQFKCQSLIQHLQDGWRFGGLLHDHFITPVPAQMRRGKEWYLGTADAIHQNINLVEKFDGEIIAVFGADHVYRMDIRQMADFHLRKKGHATVSVLSVPISEAKHFGVIAVDETMRIIGFEEKPKHPTPMPKNKDLALVSMGNYLFNKDFLIDILKHDAAHGHEGAHDFGKDILPRIHKQYPIYAYDFKKNRVPGVNKTEEVGYWRDVGTIGAYWEANMDLRNITPNFDLYNHLWPLKTSSYSYPPAKLGFDSSGRKGMAINSLVSDGSAILGGKVQDSIIGRNVLIKGDAAVINSIIMDNVVIGEGCKINMAIIDKGTVIPDGTIIGYDLSNDRKKYFVDEDSRIIVVSNKLHTEETA